MRNGHVFRQVLWEPATNATAGGLLPTPLARDHFPPHSKDYIDKKRQQGHGMSSLPDWARHDLLPTPVAQTSQGGPKGLDGGSAARQMLAAAGFPRAAGAPTPLPTPTVNDSKNSTFPPSQIDRDGLAGAMLRDDSIPTGEATYLNPSFVEEMMGFPVGWTA
jgi:hypothetical protein